MILFICSYFSIFDIQAKLEGLQKKLTVTEEKSSKLVRDIEAINSSKNSSDTKANEMAGKVGLVFGVRIGKMEN